MLRIVAELAPEAAAFYRAAIRANTNPRRDRTDSPITAVTASTGTAGAVRATPMQAKVDAFITILRTSLRADDGHTGGVDTTILVRIDLDQLLSGIGTATIDGIDQPISAATARRLAVEADLIPQVFDGKSVLLDQGDRKRLFTKAQRYAILGSHTGCAFPKCDTPSPMTEIHHIGPWATRSTHRKGTDLANGIPLCGFHNRTMEHGWTITYDDEHTPWFTPPTSIDPTQTPIRGGRITDRRAG